MRLYPAWTKSRKLSKRGLDPLGLTRLSSFIVEHLLPGLKVIANIARYYSFYAWAIKIVNKTTSSSYNDFMKKIALLESAFVIGGMLDEQEGGDRGPTGDRIAQKTLNSSEDPILLPRSILKHVGGGYGQYYNNSMRDLRITIRSLNKDLLTPQGEKIASIFNKNVTDTEYFKEFLFSKECLRNILQEFGKKSNYLRLKDEREEQEALAQILFDKSAKLRRKSLLLILDIVNTLSQNESNEIDITRDDAYLKVDDFFRNIIFYKKYSIDEKLTIDLTPYADIIEFWRYFEFHDKFSVIMEYLFCTFLRYLKDAQNAKSLNEFFDYFKDIDIEVTEILGTNVKNWKLNQIINYFLIKHRIVGDLNFRTSKKFAKKCGVKHSHCEVINIKKIENEYSNRKYRIVVARCLVTLLILIMRYYYYLNHYSEELVEIKEREYGEFSLDCVLTEERLNLFDLSFDNFFQYLIRTIIKKHDKIAIEKQESGNYTFRFNEIGEKFTYCSVLREYFPQQRNNHVSSNLFLLHDLGLIKRDNWYNITPNGRNFLELNRNE